MPALLEHARGLWEAVADPQAPFRLPLSVRSDCFGRLISRDKALSSFRRFCFAALPCGVRRHQVGPVQVLRTCVSTSGAFIVACVFDGSGCLLVTHNRRKRTQIEWRYEGIPIAV